MPPIPAGYAVAALKWRCLGDPDDMISTIGLDVVSASTPTPSEVANLVSTAWLSAWPASILSNLYTFLGTDVTFGPQPGEGPSGQDVRAVVGTITTPPPASNTALLIKKLTALGGRRNRGRMYLPAGNTEEQAIDHNGMIQTAAVPVYQTRMDSFYSALVASAPTLQPVILHGPTVAGVAPAEPTVMTGFSAQPQVATHRRRMR